jgi:plasmid maintenance system antidote protein VapI
MKKVMQSTPVLATKISKKLKELLAGHPQISQRDLALKIGIPTMVLNRAVRGESTPNADAIVRIAKYFRVTTDEILGVPPIKDKAKA